MRPVTELQNPLTMGIDATDALGMVRLLRQADAQIFAGYECHASLVDRVMVDAMGRVAVRMARLFVPNGVVLFGGAGTSGRFAHLLAMEYNRILKDHSFPEVFRSLVAGGNASLIRAQEAAEDSVEAAVRDLSFAIPEQHAGGMYVGISAGLSAPYVAAQIAHLLDVQDFETVMVGFNPASLARNAPVDGWDRTVKEVLDEALESPRFTLLNPIYGPEAITGSTRMKGGSVTRIMLDIVFAVALELAKSGTIHAVEAEEEYSALRPRIRELLRAASATVQAAYGNAEELAELVRAAGTALRSGGRIIYLGRGLAGYLGLIDASECPPTFGAGYFDVRAYLREGWEFLGAKTPVMRSRGRDYEVDHDFFEREILPQISKGDLVIAIATRSFGDNTRRLMVEANKLKATTCALLVRSDVTREANVPENVRHQCIINLPSEGFIPLAQNDLELGLKLCLNAITTGAHIMAGKVYTNVMIDLRISNSKLYDRAKRLVAQLAGVSSDEARAALHHAIFKQAQTPRQLEEVTETECIARAADRSRIVPMAILLATRKFTYQEAHDQLVGEPRVRRIIEEAICGTPN